MCLIVYNNLCAFVVIDLNIFEKLFLDKKIFGNILL
jgi:hypothetical protein